MVKMGQMVVKQEAEKLQTMEELTGICDKMIKGGFLPAEIKTVQQAVAIAMRGRDLGISATQSLSELYVVKGKVSMKSELILQLAMERIPGFSHDIIELSPTVCTVEFNRLGRKPFRYTYTIEMAKNADLLSNPTWKKYPDYMLFNRVVSFGLKMFAPDYKNLIVEVDLNDVNSKESIENLTGNKSDVTVNKETGEVINYVEAEFTNVDADDLPQDDMPFDDSESEEEVFPEEEKEEVPDELCAECGKKVSIPEKKYSSNKFGKVLCFKCQPKGAA